MHLIRFLLGLRPGPRWEPNEGKDTKRRGRKGKKGRGDKEERLCRSKKSLEHALATLVSSAADR